MKEITSVVGSPRQDFPFEYMHFLGTFLALSVTENLVVERDNISVFSPLSSISFSA